MPPEVDPAAENPDLKRALAKEGIVDQADVQDNEPSYRVVGTSKIPVSKHMGRVWQSRLDQARVARKNAEDNWSEAIRYYEHDQSVNREGGLTTESRSKLTKSGKWTETENVVFSNATTSLPMLYAKNPAIEVTPVEEEVNAEWAHCCETLINKLFGMRSAPGISLKGPAKRGILWALLTNSGYSKVGFNKKDDSHEKAIEDLRKFSQDYQNAKTKKEIEIVEGKLKALDDRISLLSPSGPIFKLVSPFRLFVDPTSTNPDHSDADWIMEEDYLPTAYINAVYGKDQEGKVVSVYEPSHVLNAQKSTVEGVQDDVNNFSLLDNRSEDEKVSEAYGYRSNKAFERAQYTKVYWIWDKTTRRLFLFACNKWEWPIWVWDDPLKLLEFFPYDHLWFHEQVEGSQPKGEVTYYLDQQDAINENNATLATARKWAKQNVFFDGEAISQADVDAVLNGPDGTARKVRLPEGKTLKDVIYAMVPPAMQYHELFSNDPHFAQINRITGINEAYRGAQFKTNTTNEAINFYKASVDIRVDEKIDAIEDWIGAIGWKLIQLLAQHWTKEDVAAVVGSKIAQHWKQIQDPNELRGVLNLRVVGGSTDKPTSKAKKNQALEIGQILGQFGNGIPAIAIIALKIIERAFTDEVIITKADWEMLMGSMQQTANPQQAQQAPPAAPGGSEGGEADAVKQQIAEAVNALPPEGKQMLQQLLDQGVPPEQALQDVMAQMQPAQAA